MPLDRTQQLGGDRIGRRLAMRRAVQQVAPPLQADFAGERLADLLADARDLDIECKQRQERAPLLRANETAMAA